MSLGLTDAFSETSADVLRWMSCNGVYCRSERCRFRRCGERILNWKFQIVCARHINTKLCAARRNPRAKFAKPAASGRLFKP